jgi:hypothetical protein
VYLEALRRSLLSGRGHSVDHDHPARVESGNTPRKESSTEDTRI